MEDVSKNIIPHSHKISKVDRAKQNGQKPCIVWFTGLSGSGKSTLANLLEQKLYELGHKTYILDGDNVRAGLNSDLDFSLEARIENIRRIGEVSNLMVDAGLVVLSAFISPLISDRERVRGLVEEDEFFEVFVNCPLEICEQRDVKGLYQKARQGLIKDFTGISSPFETPKNPDIEVNTHLESTEESVKKLLDFLVHKLKK